jgi:Putative Flp pilus-assembly TadE/G-like
MHSRHASVIASRLRSGRGTVLVLVAAGMFPFVAMLTFAIDVSHWFDYSRNLQNRADAAALAGGQQLGACIAGTGGAGSTTNGAQATAGKFAQLFSGMSYGENAVNRPYTDLQVSAAQTVAPGSGIGPGTGWDVQKFGYANNMKGTYTDAGPYNGTYSPLDLRAADLNNINDYWVALNAGDYSPSGGANTSFTMNPVGTPATFCSSDPTYDTTDAQCNTQAHGQTTGPCAVAPMVDVKVTQKGIPLFIPIFGGHPTIHAHARVTLQGEATNPDVRPIAVSDPGSFACVTVYFKNDVTNALLGTAVLRQSDPANFIFTNDTVDPAIPNSGPTSVAIPSGANVYAQPYLHDCNGNGQIFDDSTSSGIELINSYGTGTPIAGQPPRITTSGTLHGVTLSGTCTTPSDWYFSVGDCNVSPTAIVAFAVPKNDAEVTAVDLGTSPATTLNLSPDSTGTIWTPNGNQHFTIGDSSGRHPIRIDWKQTSGTVGGVTCGTGNGSQPPPCTGNFGIQAQAFGACNGCDQPDDSGPIVMSRLRLTVDPPGTTGENSFQQGTTQQLIVTLQLAGIRAETNAGAPPTILRFAGSTNHQTGLVDCGQGNGPGGSGTVADAYTIYGGCGPSNPFEPPQCTPPTGPGCQLPLMNPLYVYGRGNPIDCSPAVDQNYTGWPGANHQDCVQTTPGSRRVGIVCGLLQRITGVTAAQFNSGGGACNSQNPGTCPDNHWGNVAQFPNDPRKIDVVLTAPLDLAAADGSPQYWVPIRRFAKFYVTGWDTSLFPKCGNRGAPFNENDAFPAKGKQNSDNGAIWGHWITDIDPGGGTNGQQCPLGSIAPTNCVPVLTR